MCEEGECSLLGSRAAPSPAGLPGFNAAGTKAALQCWQRVQQRTTADGKPCSAPGGSSAQRAEWEPDPRTAGPTLQELGRASVTPRPPCHLLGPLWLQHSLCPRSWRGCSLGSSPWSGCTTWVPPPGSPSSSLWAHLGGLKELMPKSTQFPNIPTLLVHNLSSCKSGIYS